MGMSSNDESADHYCTERDQSDEGDQFDNKYSEHVDHFNKKKLEKLKSLRENVNWQVREERSKFFLELYTLISDWNVQLPDLRDIFRHEEIELLLSDSIKNMFHGLEGDKEKVFINFVARTGYKDELKFDKEGKPLLRRTTPLHCTIGNEFLNCNIVVSDLFKIYDRFDVNYIDDNNITHFDVACAYGCVEIVEKFLKICQDLNCTTTEPLLLVSLGQRHTKVAELLLREGADPNLADVDGFTPLHIIALNKTDDDLAEMFFAICNDIQHKVNIDARCKDGNTPLHIALHNGKKKMVKVLLRRGANPYLINNKGSIPLHMMCKNDVNDDLAELFFKIHNEIPMQVNAQDKKGNTPLHYALEHGLKVTVELLLRNGADPNLANAQKLTPLHIIASRNIDDDLATKFFQICDDFQHKVQVNAVESIDHYTSLHFALENGHRKLTELLLRRGVDPNSADVNGSTPLHIICKRENDDDALMKIFFETNKEINQRVQINARDKLGDTPLHLALDNGHRKLTDLLLRRGADPKLTDSEGFTPLHIICDKSDDDDIANLFFKRKKKLQVDVQNKFGDTALHLAVSRRHEKVVRLLLKKGANPHSTDQWEMTCLHIIVSRKIDDDWAEKFFEICDDIKLTIQIDAQDKNGRTPLLLALDFELKATVELLLRRGADRNLPDLEGFAPLHTICQKSDDEDLAKLFFEIGEEKKQRLQVNVQNKFGDTPLHWALNNGHRKLTELLLTRNANPNLANTEGLTPLHIICTKGKDHLMKIFFEINDEINQLVQIDAKDIAGNTPLHWAVDFGYRKLTELLLIRDANPNSGNVDGLTPLHLICDTENEGEDLAKLFFKINEEKKQLVQIDARDKWGDTPLHLALDNGHRKLTELLLRRGVDPNSADVNGSTPLHIICKRKNDDDDDLMKIFFEINEEINQLVQIDARDKLGFTPLCFALDNGHKKLTELLLRRGADPSAVNKMGETPLHIICNSESGDDDLMKIFFDINTELNHLVQIDVKDNSGYTPLYLALKRGHRRLVELLLRRGADPNLSDLQGYTPLHIICQHRNDDELTRLFFNISDEKNQLMQVNAQDMFGNTPLQWAVLYENRLMVELLLQKGADPNLADEKGATPLHQMSNKFYNNDIAKTLFKFSNNKYQLVDVNVQDELGNTPLHVAVKHDLKKVVRFLLRKGANPNLANKEGFTPLHIICQRYSASDLATMLFELSDEKYRPVQVDARDKLGRTPLQLAVANILPNMVAVLLYHGADLSSFVFPKEIHLSDILQSEHNRYYNFKLKLVSGAMIILEHLEKRGYVLDRSDALTIMKFFDEYALFGKSVVLKEHRCVDKKLARKLKRIKIRPSLSFYDLTRLRPEETAKQLTYRDYYKLAQSRKLWVLLGRHKEVCAMDLCERVSRQFFRQFALYPFWEQLIRFRLPILCCDMIMGKLTNKDLYNIFLAAISQTHEDSQKAVTSDVINSANKRPVGAKKFPKIS